MTTHATLCVSVLLAFSGCLADPGPQTNQASVGATTSPDAGSMNVNDANTSDARDANTQIDARTESSVEAQEPDAPEGKWPGERPGKWLGEKCGGDDECSSGHCTDGVCCTSATCGPCETCAGQFQEGGCSFVPVPYLDPKRSCTGNDVCDGRGACRAPPGAQCSSDADCATGYCTDGVCCATRCEEQCYSCNQPGKEGSCKVLDGEDDVAAKVTCTGRMTCVRTWEWGAACGLRDGQPCETDAECVAGSCEVYYVDRDGDGYGTTAEPPIRRCERVSDPPPGYAASAGDQCDSNPLEVCP